MKMVTNSRVEGGAQVLSAGVRRTIQSIKEIVGNHSDADIYVALKETNMDPNETAQNLLNQDPFHEVKRKRDRKKEPQKVTHKSFIAQEPRRNTELARIPEKSSSYPDPNAQRGGYGLNTASGNIPVKNSTCPDPNARRDGYGPNTTSGNIPVKNSTYTDRIVRRGGYGRNTASGASKEFRVVRDNRVGQNASADSNPDQGSISASEAVISSESIKSNSAKTSGHLEPTAAQHTSRVFNNPTDSLPKQTKVTTSGGNDRKETLGEKPLPVPSTTSHVQAKANGPTPSSSSSSSVGVYSSNSDPVHVPSLPKPDANVGPIRRDVGVVGPRRQSSESSAKPSSSPSTPGSNAQSGRDGQRESSRPFIGMSKSDNSSQNIAPESSTDGLPVSKSFSSNQYVSRPHQSTGHQKASQANKKWKPKASVKPSTSGPGVIGAPAKVVSPSSDKLDVLRKEAAQKQDSISQLNISENKNVIIAAHIRVSETDRCRLTFGSLGTELYASKNSTSITADGAEVLSTDPGSVSVSVSASASDSPGDEQAGGGKQLEMLNDSVQSSVSDSHSAEDVSDHQLTEKKESYVPPNLDDYVDVGLVRDHTPSYTPESLQQQDTPELPSFSGYDPQMGYDMSCFRPIANETVRGQGLSSSQEVLNTHTTNSIPASTIAIVQQQKQQQQQQQVAQIYPQLHVSHFANLMPYRQFISPVYVPPMPVSGYSNSPAYPHPSNGNSYVLMPGNSSHHLTTNVIKYGIQQFKPVPSGGQAGFGNFTSPAGYTINTPGIVTSSGAHDDASRIKYKDNLYVSNPQAETPEIWMNPRDVLGLQSASYYNLPGQTPHPAYLTSHNGRTSFSTAQSSHMQQFPGIYHPPPQPAAIAGPHHLGPVIGGGVAAPAPGAQVGAYQQPQLGHLNWVGNF